MLRRFSDGECVAIFLIAAIAISAVVQGQTLYGSLTGTVVDASQAVVPNARVEVENTLTGVKRQATTNEAGIYAFNDLQPGIYKVTISGAAFAAVAREGIAIEANRQRRVDATLQVAQVTESVLVSSAAEALQTDRADVNVNLSSKQVTDLPVTGSMGRNFQSMLTLVPGVIMAGESNSDAGNPQRAIGVNVNGVSRNQNNTRIDGATNIYPYLNTNIAYVPSVEAIEVVNVVTNAYNAEQGIAGGAAMNVIIKSGTNDYHGTGWGFNLNSHFKARNFFQTTPQNPKAILNQFGLNFGGPVWIPKVFDGKNKLFFFVNWERTTQRRTSPPRFFSVAPQDLRNGDFTATGTTVYDPASNSNPALRTPFPTNRIPATRFDLAANELIQLLPAPTVAGAYVNNFVGSGSAPFDRDNIDIKVNEHVTDKFSYFGRYSTSPHNAVDPPIFGKAVGDATFGGQLGQALGRIQIGGAGATYTITPTLLFDVSLGFTRQRLGAQGPDLGSNLGLDLLKIPDTNGADLLQSGMPAFQIGGWSNLGNANTGSPFVFRDNQYVASLNLGWLRSKHSFRFGYDYMNQQINHFQPQGGTFQTTRGTFTFNGNAAALQNGPAADRFHSWAAFLLGLPTRAGKVEQLRNPNSLRINVYALYAQDQWQATRNLTVNLGARWEYYPFLTRDWGGVSRFDPADGRVYIGGVGSTPLDTGVNQGWGRIVPRIGLAYRLGSRTVVRTGYGMSVDPRTFTDFRNAFPINFAWEIPAPQNPFVPVTTLRQGLQASVYRQPVNLNQPFIVLQGGTGTVTVPRDAMRKYIQSWNFVVQHELTGGFVAQAGYVGTRATGQMGGININSAAPGTGTAGRALFPRFGLSGDISMVMPYHTTTYDGLQTQLTRRWGDSMFGAVYTWSKTINWADNDGGPRIQWLPEAGRNRGAAGYDRTHVFQSYFALASPFGKGKGWASSGISRHILEGWQLNGVFGAQSGVPIFIVQNNAINLNAPGSGQMPDQVKPEVAILGGVGPGRPWFDTTAFRVVNIPANQPQRFGNAGRNNVRGPRLVNLDAGLFRTFNVGERVRLQLRAESLNVLNHPNFSLGLQFDGNANASDPAQFGIISYTIGANNATGFSGKGTGERQFRFAVRLYF
jgi:hypothetical protein